MIQRIQNSKWVFVLISVFLAVIFWMYVRNDLDPPGSRTIYNVPVTLTGETILESQGLTITAVSDTAVDLKITAPISILNKLSNRNLSVTVNVSQCTEGEQILQYDVNWPRDVSTAEITKESQEPAAITVMVARLYSKTFEIQPVLKASIAPGYQAGQITISPETVTISGSEEAVSRVAKVEAVLEGEELNTRFSGNVPLVLLDAEGNELTDLEINMDTDTTYVTMPVYVVKEVKLTVNRKDNIALYDYLLEKLNDKRYFGVGSFLSYYRTLLKAKEIFGTLSVLKQAETLLQILRFFKCNAETSDLSTIGGPTKSGKITVDKNITETDFSIIHRSACGLTERRQKV